MKIKHYYLDENKKVRMTYDLMKWAKITEKAKDNHVADDTINGIRISTVFLSLDYAFCSGRAPVLWESMAFNNGVSIDCVRCSGSISQAEAMHKEMCNKYFGVTKKK